MREPKDEVKRVYGLALTHTSLAVQFGRRARGRDREGRTDLADKDIVVAREHAREGIAGFAKVLEIDDQLAEQQIVAPRRTSASLKPRAHAGIAQCEIVLADEKNLEHLERAEHHLLEFARAAATARKFWEQRRERLLVTDPMHDEGMPGAETLDPETKQRYEMRIVGTIQQEAEIRAALMHTYLYLNRYRDAINEATAILNLDPTREEIYLWRGNAYAYLDPPNYRAAVKDLKEYRRSLDLTRLTEEMVQINKRIERYEELAGGEGSS
jgi:hypothetical protein